MLMYAFSIAEFLKEQTKLYSVVHLVYLFLNRIFCVQYASKLNSDFCQ